MTVQLHADKD